MALELELLLKISDSYNKFIFYFQSYDVFFKFAFDQVKKLQTQKMQQGTEKFNFYQQ